MNGKYYLPYLNFVTFPLLSLKSALKITKIYYEILADTGMLLVMKLMLEEEYQELFVIMQKQIINICMIMINPEKANTFHILILTISMVALHHKKFLRRTRIF